MGEVHTPSPRRVQMLWLPAVETDRISTTCCILYVDWSKREKSEYGFENSECREMVAALKRKKSRNPNGLSDEETVKYYY
jgi:hypothetical protein